MEALVVELEVKASPEHAFAVWTERVNSWWPTSHTMTTGGEVVLEPYPGGRIFERANDGTEHDWGEIVAWEPPHRLACVWHLFFDRSEATDLEVCFEPIAVGTKVVIRQTGWERLAAAGAERRARTSAAWSEIGEHYRAYLEASN